MARTKYQDWIPYFDKLFEQIKIKNFLEFGLGEGTEYFLNKCDSVTSIEISTSPRHKKWYDKCKEKYIGYRNWKPIYIKGSDKIIKADQLANKHGNPISYNDHIPELKKVIQSITSQDMIFVDSGIHNRGDILNLLFEENRFDIITAHDTSRKKMRYYSIYGYNILKVPNDFAEFHFEGGTVGTTFWIKENKLGINNV